MRHSKFVRLFAVVAVAGSAAIATVPFAGPASAATLSIKCSSLKGNIGTTVTASKCSGNTGKASKAIKATLLASGGKITWVNGKTTTVKLTVKAGGTACPAGSSEYVATGTVTADTTGSATVGGKVKGSACVDSAGNLTLVPGTKLTI
jgi:hypothetical protein